MSRALTVEEIARAIQCSEQRARNYLREVDPRIEVYLEKPTELVERQIVIELCRIYEGRLVGRRLLRLLGETQI
ncbi:MAG: hypothetical protein E3J66_03465 [Dehalococcoidia bacterium]|nr:MAG: hypothetical protein E3J66_03465 [Dehalococcoidia bacterium]